MLKEARSVLAAKVYVGIIVHRNEAAAVGCSKGQKKQQ